MDFCLPSADYSPRHISLILKNNDILYLFLLFALFIIVSWVCVILVIRSVKKRDYPANTEESVVSLISEAFSMLYTV